MSGERVGEAGCAEGTVAFAAGWCDFGVGSGEDACFAGSGCVDYSGFD